MKNKKQTTPTQWKWKSQDQKRTEMTISTTRINRKKQDTTIRYSPNSKNSEMHKGKEQKREEEKRKQQKRAEGERNEKHMIEMH